MISTQDIKNKEVINIYDGKSLGFVEDIEVNLERGTIEGIIVPEPRGFLSFFSKNGEHVIKWRDIRRIGDDVILVDVAGISDMDYDRTFEREEVELPRSFTRRTEEWEAPEEEEDGENEKDQ